VREIRTYGRVLSNAGELEDFTIGTSGAIGFQARPRVASGRRPNRQRALLPRWRLVGWLSTTRLAIDKYRELGVREHLNCLAAEEDRRGTVAAM
jgi:hypothetical protein